MLQVGFDDFFRKDLFVPNRTANSVVEAKIRSSGLFSEPLLLNGAGDGWDSQATSEAATRAPPPSRVRNFRRDTPNDSSMAYPGSSCSPWERMRVCMMVFPLGG